jgi:exonuclease III
MLQQKFPYLPEKMAMETLKCLHPLPNFTIPNPIQNHPILNPRNMPHTTPTTNMISWNCGAFNTALPGLQALINRHIPLAIIAIQETKLTASKSTKYLQRMFPQYKMIFNNTIAKTQTHRTHGQPKNDPKGGLLTLIHQQYAFPGNITKIPTTNNISPYLQIIKIVNHPLPTYHLIHLYVPTHIEDIIHIPTIQTTIFNHIHNNPQSNIILFGDFNRDIAFIGRQNGVTNTAPTQQDLEWKQFTNSLHLKYIPTDTNYSYQGGYSYTSTSLIDGFYIKLHQNTPNINAFTSRTILNLKQNLDHYPINLSIPPNNITSKIHLPPTNINKPKILNPLPPENINKFHIKFSETNTNLIHQLTAILKNNRKLPPHQWQLICENMDQMVKNISKIIEDTCTALPIPILTNQASKQGGFLPRKLQKQWKKELSTYHIIRKAIKISTQNANWRSHIIFTQLQNHQHTNIPNPPSVPTLINEWIRILGNIGKNAKKNARDIITKKTSINCKKEIAKYRNILNLQPKRIHKVIFKNTENTTLDCITDRQGNILTNPEDIAEEIYIQQSILNQPVIPTCYHLPNHDPDCVCGVRQYLWQDLNGFVLEKRGTTNASIANTFDRNTYDLCLRNLGNNKAPGPDNIPNSILKNMPTQFHNLLYLFFHQCYKQQQIPASWKTSLTILLYKKSDPSILTNHRPIALANTIYKLFTNTITAQLASYSEKHQILQNSQEGFR